MNRKKIIRVCLILLPLAFILTALYLADYYNLLPQKVYSASDFNIETLHSPVDFNNNGTDDYTDFLLGARADAQQHPKYDGSYFEGGYPPEDTGVCTDVVWRAFRSAGYSLKDMVDRDIRQHPELYPAVNAEPDPNIDFRRVRNLSAFFARYAVPLTLDTSQINQWQPGDIVIYHKESHIGIVSDRRNQKGLPYLIHNAGQPVREEDAITRQRIIGHYRFDASLLDGSVLSSFE